MLVRLIPQLEIKKSTPEFSIKIQKIHSYFHCYFWACIAKRSFLRPKKWKFHKLREVPLLDKSIPSVLRKQSEGQMWQDQRRKWTFELSMDFLQCHSRPALSCRIILFVTVRLESLPLERNHQNTTTFHRYKFAPFDWGHGSLPTTSKPMATLRHAKLCLHCFIRQDHRKATSPTPLTLEDLGSKPFHEVIQVSQKTLVLSCHVMQPNPLWASRSHKELSPFTVPQHKWSTFAAANATNV